MRALLDINVIIALLDPDHTFHDRAHAWWAQNQSEGWASCPITENGVVRIMSNPGYSERARFAPADLIARLGTFAAQTNHEFWPDDISLRNPEVFTPERILGSRQLTDIYLLALATKHTGRLVTFDGNISLEPARSPSARFTKRSARLLIFEDPRAPSSSHFRSPRRHNSVRYLPLSLREPSGRTRKNPRTSSLFFTGGRGAGESFGFSSLQ